MARLWKPEIDYIVNLLNEQDSKIEERIEGKLRREEKVENEYKKRGLIRSAIEKLKKL